MYAGVCIYIYACIYSNKYFHISIYVYMHFADICIHNYICIYLNKYSIFTYM